MNQVEQECFAGAPQDFLICITVHKAANTGINVGELYVKVRLDKLSKNTKTYANSENPFFNEVSNSCNILMGLSNNIPNNIYNIYILAFLRAHSTLCSSFTAR